MYFRDLSMYVYGGTPPQPHVLNVGWLSRDHPFPRGTPPASLPARLAELVKSPVNLYRGLHLCEFCPEPPTMLSPGGIKMMNPPAGTAGNGEIRVASSDGNIYVAPVLIYHYVTAHGYVPPREFVDAVDAALP
jgi:hypothetical protein